jgi:hypothetical protein
MRLERPTPRQLGLTAEEGSLLRALRTPARIQEFVIGLHANFEFRGDTLRSVRGVLQHRQAHCIEAAFVAACALWLSGDPPLRSLRELAMSYLHEYTNRQRKSLRSYSVPVDLRRFATAMWVTNDQDCWEVGAALCDVRHFPLLSPAQARRLARRDATEMRADNIVQYDSRRDRKRARRY